MNEDLYMLARLRDAGWRVEEVGLRGRVVAEWEDLGVFVSLERHPTPYKWWAWLHDENTALGSDTLDGALEDLAAQLVSTAAQVRDFVEGKR